MSIRNIFVEAWSALTATGLVIVALTLVLAPFLISLVANIGRRAPKPARIKPPKCRTAQAVRTLPS